MHPPLQSLALMAFLLGLCMGHAMPANVYCTFGEGSSLGVPDLAAEVFRPPFSPMPADPVLYDGRMALRGSLTFLTVKSEQEREKVVLRSKDIDLRKMLTVAGATHRTDDGAVTYYRPEQLPAIEVQYAPDVPEEAALHEDEKEGRKAITLLYRVGVGKEGEWKEGHWNLSVKFDPGTSDLRLRKYSSSSNTVYVGDREKRPVLVYSVNFRSKRVQTPEDEHNLLLYEYQSLLVSTEKRLRVSAVVPLQKLVAAYPSDPNFRWEQVELLFEGGRSDEAMREADSLVNLLRSGELRRPLMVQGDRLRGEEAVKWVELRTKAMKAWALSQRENEKKEEQNK